jgi:hypothetical protein
MTKATCGSPQVAFLLGPSFGPRGPDAGQTSQSTMTVAPGLA